MSAIKCLTPVWLACVALLVFHPWLQAGEPPAVPITFSAYIGGYLFDSYTVELKDGKLIHTAFGPGHHSIKKTTIKPSTEQWVEFRKTLDDLKVWKWRNEYLNSVADGTQWSFEIVYSDHTLKSSGSNSYPTSNGRPSKDTQITDTFNSYLAAVKKLAGGKVFE